MGYDMSIVDQVVRAPEAEVEAARKVLDELQERNKSLHQAALQAWEAAGKDPERLREFTHTAELKAAESEMWQARTDYYRLDDPGYFRLNIWGMSRYASAMFQIGMLHNAGRSTLEWPAYPELDEDATPEQEEEADRLYDEACEPLRRDHGDSPDPTIPDFKFGSNDGWIVTPDEIEAALKVHDSVSLDQRRAALAEQGIEESGWEEWLDYLRLAKDHGGFAVH